mmetsp:Transcript_85086/g.150458  ORF Transcript_85086/g.150458 Transcript_85086/m.150458 type:complete len:440 (+) Transcript_85086:52-1371(+)
MGRSSKLRLGRTARAKKGTLLKASKARQEKRGSRPRASRRIPRTLSARPKFHLVYSTNWVFKGKVDPTLPEMLQEVSRRINARQPLCCDLTDLNFCSLLAKVARAQGFDVVRWPVRSQTQWLELGEAARTGQMEPGSAAVLMHSWHGSFEKECVPAWDFYPVLDQISARNQLLYPSASLDRLHSEKRYTSKLMPPTKFLHLLRGSGGSDWRVKGHGKKSVCQVAREALVALRKEAKAADLSPDNVMVKQGLSWGGNAVTRLAPSDVPNFIKTQVLPKIPDQASELTVLLQAKIDLVSELRWVILDGELRGRGWVTLHEPRLGRKAVTAGYKNEAKCRDALEKAGFITDDESRIALEESMRRKVKQVFEEAVADAGGQVPQYLRVDLLLDKQGRAWLGERESWGADLIRNQKNPCGRSNPNRTEVASAIVSRALHHACKK